MNSSRYAEDSQAIEMIDMICRPTDTDGVILLEHDEPLHCSSRHSPFDDLNTDETPKSQVQIFSKHVLYLLIIWNNLLNYCIKALIYKIYKIWRIYALHILYYVLVHYVSIIIVHYVKVLKL